MTSERLRSIVACGLALSTSSLAGCAALGGLAGATAAIATGAATTNPAISLSVGIAVKAVTDQVLKTVALHRQRERQNAIASVVGDMRAGDSSAWAFTHRYGSGSDHGEVVVIRLIDTPLAQCKEILFSVVEGDASAKPAWFTTTACKHDGHWKWAAAEPAVERWGNLQ